MTREIEIRQRGNTCEVVAGGESKFTGGRVEAKRRAEKLHRLSGWPVFNVKKGGTRVPVNYPPVVIITKSGPVMVEVDYASMLAQGGWPETKPVTVAAVNRAIKTAGGAEKLTRGRGYYYFRGGDTGAWRETSVYVNRVDALTLERWLKEWRSLSVR